MVVDFHLLTSSTSTKKLFFIFTNFFRLAPVLDLCLTAFCTLDYRTKTVFRFQQNIFCFFIRLLTLEPPVSLLFFIYIFVYFVLRFYWNSFPLHVSERSVMESCICDSEIVSCGNRFYGHICIGKRLHDQRWRKTCTTAATASKKIAWPTMLILKKCEKNHSLCWISKTKNINFSP